MEAKQEPGKQKKREQPDPVVVDKTLSKASLPKREEKPKAELPTPKAVEKSDLAAVAEVLGRANFSYPMYCAVEPKDDKRKAVLPWIMKCYLKFGMRYGEAYTVGNPPQGAAICFAPGKFAMTPWRMMRSGLLQAPFKVRLSSLMRFLKTTKGLDRMHSKEAPMPHYYLMALGVDTEIQQKGTGKALLTPLLKKADEEGVPFYLQTSNEKNVAYYQKFGFEVLSAGFESGCCTFWSMMRKPKG